jgi:hypothetical protein
MRLAKAFRVSTFAVHFGERFVAFVQRDPRNACPPYSIAGPKAPSLAADDAAATPVQHPARVAPKHGSPQ